MNSFQKSCNNAFYYSFDKVYGNEGDSLFYDLGLGKETRFYYPWNPKDSPSICKEANEDLSKYQLHLNILLDVFVC